MDFESAYNSSIILDGDAWKDSQKLYYKLNGGRLFGKVSVVRLPEDKDIADLQGDYSEYPPFQID